MVFFFTLQSMRTNCNWSPFNEANPFFLYVSHKLAAIMAMITESLSPKLLNANKDPSCVNNLKKNYKIIGTY